MPRLFVTGRTGYLGSEVDRVAAELLETPARQDVQPLSDPRGERFERVNHHWQEIFGGTEPQLADGSSTGVFAEIGAQATTCEIWLLGDMTPKPHSTIAENTTPKIKFADRKSVV